VSSLLDDAETMRLGNAAYRLWRRRYSPEAALEALESGYAEAQRQRAHGRRRGHPAPGAGGRIEAR